MSKSPDQVPHFEEQAAPKQGINLSAIAVRERSVTLFFIVLIVCVGVLAYLKLGRAEDPKFTVKVFTVVAAWPGATAEEMQNLVAEPLEKRMQELTYYDHVDTFTRPGLAFLTVTLQDYTPPDKVPDEFYQGRKKIQDEASRLPQGVLPPVVNDEYTDVVFAIYSIKAKGLPLRQLARQTETVREDLLHVPGTKKVTLFGEQPERIFIDFSYDRIARGLYSNVSRDTRCRFNSRNAKRKMMRVVATSYAGSATTTFGQSMTPVTAPPEKRMLCG